MNFYDTTITAKKYFCRYFYLFIYFNNTLSFIFTLDIKFLYFIF